MKRMKYIRKHNAIHPFIWLLLCILNYEVLFVAIMWMLTTLLDLIKFGCLRHPLTLFLCDGNCLVLWIALPLFVGNSISLMRSAVTEITIKEDARELVFVYHTAVSLFFQRKEMVVRFDDLDYYVDRIKCRKAKSLFLPFRPMDGIIIYRNDAFLLQFGCGMGWTWSQFNELESEFNKIRPPVTKPKTF